MDADAIVVGAGPAGASAAFYLARRGRRVLLLERHQFPRDKSCGDGLTRFTTRQLAEMGVLDHLPEAAPSCGVRVHMRGRGHRDFRYPDDPNQSGYGRVVPRLILDHAICARAESAGAELWQNTLASDLIRNEVGAVTGVRVMRNGEERTLRTAVVIVADGAASRLGRQAGLIATPPDGMGYAIRAYYEGIDGLTDLLEIYMPLLDPTDRYLLPSYGWVFPTGPGSANIGVGLVRRERDANVRELLSRFLDDLQRDSRFRNVRQIGDWRGAPLRFDFLPERCSAPGVLLVGDAAGMISPFTGEGIGYALTSGCLAAETVHTALNGSNGDDLDLSGYPAALARRFTGYFEAGRESALRYKLIWHVLESTFQNEKPLFNVCRRAALFPEGIGESYVKEAFEDVGPALRGDGNESGDPDESPNGNAELGTVRADLIAIGEQLIGTVRYNWPFLAKVVTVEETVPGIPFRPALLLLLAGRVGSPRREALVSVGAAVELGFVAALSHASVGDDEAPGLGGRDDNSANWGNMFALMVGDFLLSNAYATSAHVAAEVSREIASAVSTASEGHVQTLRNAFNTDLTPDEQLMILQKKAGTLFELPCRLGARLSAAPPRVVAALATYGRHLGTAYQLIDDLLAVAGRASELGRAIGPNRVEGIYGFPIIHSLHTDARADLKQELALLRAGKGDPRRAQVLVIESGGVDATLARATSAIGRAKESLRAIADGNTKSWLLRLADYVAERVRM
jgi:geranylgeranyl reductase family protein